MVNFQITQGMGTTIATDIGGGGENYQKIKLIDATPGATSGTGIATNPLHVDVDNFPSTQDVNVTNSTLAVTQSTSPWIVSGTVTVDIGTTNGLALDSSLSTINITLGSPFQAGGSIGNTAFGISGTLPAFASTPTFNLGTLNGAATATNQTDGSQKTKLVDGSGNIITSTSNALDVNVKSMTNGAASSAVTSVARSASSQTFLAANTNRKGATLYNDSGALLYVKFGTTASSSDFTVRLASQSYYEIPFSYTGRIDGIWASAGIGDVRITELS